MIGQESQAQAQAQESLLYLRIKQLRNDLYDIDVTDKTHEELIALMTQVNREMTQVNHDMTEWKKYTQSPEFGARVVRELNEKLVTAIGESKHDINTLEPEEILDPREVMPKLVEEILETEEMLEPEDILKSAEMLELVKKMLEPGKRKQPRKQIVINPKPLTKHDSSLKEMSYQNAAEENRKEEHKTSRKEEHKTSRKETLTEKRGLSPIEQEMTRRNTIIAEITTHPFEYSAHIGRAIVRAATLENNMLELTKLIMSIIPRIPRINISQLTTYLQQEARAVEAGAFADARRNINKERQGLQELLIKFLYGTEEGKQLCEQLIVGLITAMEQPYPYPSTLEKNILKFDTKSIPTFGFPFETHEKQITYNILYISISNAIELVIQSKGANIAAYIDYTQPELGRIISGNFSSEKATGICSDILYNSNDIKLAKILDGASSELELKKHNYRINIIPIIKLEEKALDVLDTQIEQDTIRDYIKEKVAASPTLHILGYFNKFSKMLEDLIIYNTYTTPQSERPPQHVERAPLIQLSDPDAPDINNQTSMVLYCYLHGGKEIINQDYSIFIVKPEMQVILITNAIRGEVTVAVRSTRYLSYYEMSGLGEGTAGYPNYRKYGSFKDFTSRVDERGGVIDYDKPYNYTRKVIPELFYPHKESDQSLLFVFYIISTFRSIMHKIFPLQDPTHKSTKFKKLVKEYIIKNPDVKTKPLMMQMLTAIIARGRESSRLTAVNTFLRYWEGPGPPTVLTVPESLYGAFPVIIKNILNVNIVNSILNDVTYNQKPSLSLRNKGFQPDYPYNDKCFKADYTLSRSRRLNIANIRIKGTGQLPIKGCYFPATPAFRYNSNGRINGTTNPSRTGVPEVEFDITDPTNVYNTAIMILMLNDYLKSEEITDADLGFAFPNGGNFYSPRDICVVHDIKFIIPEKTNVLTGAVFARRGVVIRAGESFLANPHVVEYFIKIYDCLITLRPIYDKEKSLTDNGDKHYDVGGMYAHAPDPIDPKPIPFIPEGSNNYVYKVFLQDATLLQIIRFCEHAGITKFIMNDNSCDTLTVEDDNTITVMETQALSRLVTGYGDEQEEALRNQLLGIETIPDSPMLTQETDLGEGGGGASRHRFMHHALSTGKNIIMNANKIMNVGKNMLVKSVGKINSTNKSHRRNSYRSSNHDTSVKAASSTSKVAKRTRRRGHPHPRRKTRKV